MINLLAEFSSARLDWQEVADNRAIVFGMMGKRVNYMVSRGKAQEVRERLLRKTNGVWPIGLRVKEV